MKKIFLLFLLVVACISCDNRVNVVDIFVYNGEKLPLSLQKERLHYGKLLQPVVTDAHVEFPELSAIEEIPAEYINYVRDYTRLINNYLNKFSTQKRDDILLIVKNNNIEDLILFDYMKRVNDTVALTLTREDAEKMGMSLDNYDKQIEVLTLFNAEENISNKNVVNRENISTSIFLNHSVLGILVPEHIESFNQDFARLNDEYTH